LIESAPHGYQLDSYRTIKNAKAQYWILTDLKYLIKNVIENFLLQLLSISESRVRVKGSLGKDVAMSYPLTAIRHRVRFRE
jgi:hypothetical protein